MPNFVKVSITRDRVLKKPYFTTVPQVQHNTLSFQLSYAPTGDTDMIDMDNGPTEMIDMDNDGPDTMKDMDDATEDELELQVLRLDSV